MVDNLEEAPRGRGIFDLLDDLRTVGRGVEVGQVEYGDGASVGGRS